MFLIDLTWLSRFSAVVVAYYGFLFLMRAARARRRAPAPSVEGRRRPLLALVVPAHNEEAVLRHTLDALAELSYAERLIVVMDDGSTDDTAAIASAFAARRDDVLVVSRDSSIAGQGKGAVLNHAFALLTAMVTAGDPRMRGRSTDQVVMGVMDADGQLEKHTLARVAPFFNDPTVGGVQIGVRIANATTNALARMQDMEFVGFSAFVQEARDGLGSVGLGGYGQFARLSALASLGDAPWTDCLTEDLDLSLTLAEAGWRIRFCPEAYVAQQGLPSVKPLLRQRTRWVQGHYQCWSHLPTIWRAKSLPLITKLDLSVYLLLVTFVLAVTAGVVISLGSLTGLYTVENNFLTFTGDGPLHNFLLEVVSFGPLVGFLYTYQRRSQNPLNWWEVPAFGTLFSLYAYLFVTCHLWAWTRMLFGRGAWAKTPRVAAERVV
jgi:cellulose synthase/poly-beta-1,6-N-acetylglucosamine synthase-like glycosyltransferase